MWLELVPVISFALLKGKCHTCRQPISFQYPLVELASGAMWLYLFLHFGFTISAFSRGLLFILLLAVAVIDLQNLIIPNKLIVAGLIIGIADFAFVSHNGLLDAGTSAVLAGTFFLLVRAIGNFIFKRETMGWGDVKLVLLIGFIIGFENFLIAVWLAAMLGILYWIAARFFKGARRDTKLPFGSFISFTSFLLVLFPWTKLPLLH